MIAAAQFLSYYERPTVLNLSFPERDCTSSTLNWTVIKTHTHDHSVDVKPTPDPLTGLYQTTLCRADDKDHKDIGRLCRQIGYSINANYELQQTGASTPNAINYINNTWMSDYTRYSTTNPDKNTIKSIISGGPAIIGNVGHAWMADGYVQVHVYIRTYSRTSSIDYWKLDDEVFKENKELVHMNWGWNGRCNGYFDLGVYRTLQGYQYDYETPAPTADYNFNNPNLTFYYLRK